MKFTYTIDKNDLLEMHMVLFGHSQRASAGRWRIAVAYGIAFAFCAAFFGLEGNGLGVVLFGLLAVIWILLYPPYALRHYRRSLQTNLQAIFPFTDDLPTELEVMEDCIVERQAGIETRAPFGAVVEMVETRVQVIIRLKNGVIFLVPKLRVEGVEELIGALEEIALGKGIAYSRVMRG
jgi:hypothetical protein